MSFLRGLLWFLFAIALIAVSIHLTGNYEVAERFMGLFLAVQPWLPLTLDFDQFLVVLTVVNLLVVALVISGCAALLVLLGVRLSVARQRQAAHAAAGKKELEHLVEQRQKQYQQLLGLGQSFVNTEQLDKRKLLQMIVEAASRMTSSAKADSYVSCWLLDVPTDTFRFELGRYCDETWFAKPQVPPTELPFSRVVSTQKPVMFPDGAASLPLIKPEKAAKAGA